MAVKDGNVRITVTLTQDEYERVCDLSEELGCSKGSAAVWMMRRYDELQSQVLVRGHKMAEVRNKLMQLVRSYGNVAERYRDRMEAATDEVAFESALTWRSCYKVAHDDMADLLDSFDAASGIKHMQ